MAERYTRPPLVPREAAPAWRATWRFRAVALVLLAVVAFAAVRLVQGFSAATGQDPGVGGYGPTPSASPSG